MDQFIIDGTCQTQPHPHSFSLILESSSSTKTDQIFAHSVSFNTHSLHVGHVQDAHQGHPHETGYAWLPGPCWISLFVVVLYHFSTDSKRPFVAICGLIQARTATSGIDSSGEDGWASCARRNILTISPTGPSSFAIL